MSYRRNNSIMINAMIKNNGNEYLNLATSDIHYGLHKDGNTYNFLTSPDITPGATLLDKRDGKYYLALTCDVDSNPFGDSLICSLIHAQISLTVSRFSEGTVNSFGRELSSEPSLVYNGIWGAYQSRVNVFDFEPDRTIPTGKSMVMIPALYSVKENDRLTFPDGQTFMVNSLDPYSHPGILSMIISVDSR
jgi:hypothetical protein